MHCNEENFSIIVNFIIIGKTTFVIMQVDLHKVENQKLSFDIVVQTFL